MTAGLHDGPAPPQNGMTVGKDAEAVFRAANAAGVLSAGQAGRNRAGHCFCMFHDGDGTAWFRRRDSRTHVTMAARRAGNAA